MIIVPCVGFLFLAPEVRDMARLLQIEQAIRWIGRQCMVGQNRGIVNPRPGRTGPRQTLSSSFNPLLQYSNNPKVSERVSNLLSAVDQSRVLRARILYFLALAWLATASIAFFTFSGSPR